MTQLKVLHYITSLSGSSPAFCRILSKKRGESLGRSHHMRDDVLSMHGCMRGFGNRVIAHAFVNRFCATSPTPISPTNNELVPFRLLN